MADVFPDPLTYRYPEWVRIGDYYLHSHDVVSFGTPLTPENVIEAYRKGIFPWYTDGIPLPWHCPERRAILEFNRLTVPRSLEKERKKNKFKFTIDAAFEAVILECSRAYRPGQVGTWITPEFREVYTELNERGEAHSVEAWNAEGKLVGGLYGIDAGGVFCGESMFYKEANASKLALLFLIEHLTTRGSTWLDAQVMTPHMQALGAREIARRNFLALLRYAQSQGFELFPKTPREL